MHTTQTVPKDGSPQFNENIRTLLQIMVPIVAVVVAFFSAKSELNAKIDSIQLENTKTFARQSDMNEIAKYLNTMRIDLSEIKGYLAALAGKKNRDRSNE